MKRLWSSQTTSHKQKKMALNNGGSDSGVSKRVSDATNDFYKQFFLCSDVLRNMRNSHVMLRDQSQEV